MAHGDYHCCAVCDCKMAYSNDAKTKESICGPCVADMARQGVICGTVEELTTWIAQNPPEKVAEVLTKAGFQKCFYTGEIDQVVENKCPGVFVR